MKDLTDMVQKQISANGSRNITKKITGSIVKKQHYPLNQESLTIVASLQVMLSSMDQTSCLNTVLYLEAGLFMVRSLQVFSPVAFYHS